jgi:hypothetical protein
METRNAYTISMTKPSVKLQLGLLRSRWEGNINIRETVCKDGRRIELNVDHGQWWNTVLTASSLRILLAVS